MERLLSIVVFLLFGVCRSTASCASGVMSCKNGAACPLANQQMPGCTCSTCTCPTCLTGSLCETVDDTQSSSCDFCSSSPCPSANYTCTNVYRTYSCACTDGYTGTNCEFFINDPCALYPCLNGGTCKSTGNSTGATYTCSCAGSWIGAQCQFNNNPCNGMTCNNGVCKPLFGGAKAYCKCNANWQGTFCNEPIPERTKSGTEACYKAVPSLNSSDFDAIEDDNMTPGMCRNKMMANTQYEVFILAGTICYVGKNSPVFGTIQIDSACWEDCGGDGTSKCGTNDYVWLYSYPYTNEATQCTSPALCSGGGNGQCIEKYGAFECVCAPGKALPNCLTSSDPCTSLSCQNGGTCTKTADQSAAYCLCKSGFSGSTCAVTDQCAVNKPCGNGGVCTNINETAYSCSCTNLFTGPTCNTYVACKSSPCKNGGTCTDVPNGLDSTFTCACVSGWKGLLCQTDIDECSNGTKLCQNFGTCVNLPGSYKCACIPGTEGADCSTNPDDCIGQNYLHDEKTYDNRCGIFDPNATCIDGFANYTCDCGDAWTGEYCDEDVDECAWNMTLCYNFGTCDNLPGSYQCLCIFGTYGADCSENPDDCKIHPVTVGGTTYDSACIVKDANANCTDGFGAFTCTCGEPTNDVMNCTKPWTGSDCQTNVNECSVCSSPCYNFGTCYDIEGSYYCKCIAGTEGEDCSINPDDCANATEPCDGTDKKAVCVDGYAEYSCVCGPDYTGKRCDLELIIWKVLQLIGANGENEEDLIQMMRDLLNNPSMMKDLVPFIIGLLNETDRMDRSWDSEDLFLWAAYEEKRLDLDKDFEKWNDVVLGNCFTFNHLNNTRIYKARSDGAQGGLRVATKLNTDEYVPWVETVAIMAFVHPREEVIFSESPRYNAEPGGQTAIQVIESRYERLGGRYGRCVKTTSEVDSYYYEGSYTTDGCLRSCYQDQVQKACSCMDSRYPRSASSVACQLPNRECVQKITDKGDVSKWAGCICPLPCENSQFDGSWTRTPFVHNVAKCYPLEKKSRDNSTECLLGTTTPDYVLINVQIPKISVNIYVESPAWNLNRLIGNIGGLGAVVCGISLMTFFEFMFLFFKLGGDVCRGVN